MKISLAALRAPMAALGVAALGVFAAGGIAQAAGGNSATITYTASPPNHFAFAAAPAGAFPTPSQCVTAFGLACYTPQEIRTAYNVPSSLTGAGQTIVIIDAYGSPTIRQDLATFDATFGLPKAQLNIMYPDGKATFNPNKATEVGWAEEVSLDVEWSHAIAPGATIDLLIAPTAAGNVLNDVENYAVQNHLGNVMSMSFGAPEAAIAGGGNNLQLQQADQIYRAAAAAGISVFASAGDNGAGNGYSYPNALFPASDPYVTSVGGTDLFMSDSGQYQSETVWNDSDATLCPFGCAYGPFGATGGAPSAVFQAPSYQAGVTGQSMRSTSDVSYNASVYTSVLVYLGFLGPNSGFYFFGGTSEGAPQWAAITALADQAAGHPLGFLNPQLYQIAQNPAAYAADFHDVTVGQNGFGSTGYSAGTGYDLPTGLGSPDVANLINTLAGH
ncbi:MAG: S53 family peptidase [Thermaerobacter sp.]|nr:S53 family peptidase [Thermaerobacter sp.]